MEMLNRTDLCYLLQLPETQVTVRDMPLKVDSPLDPSSLGNCLVNGEQYQSVYSAASEMKTEVPSYPGCSPLSLSIVPSLPKTQK